jgi:hypothetical protein
MIEQPDTEILARDNNGTEHQLKVAEYLGSLISVDGDSVRLVLAPDAALELAWQLLCAVSRQRYREVGPLSSRVRTGRG